MFAERVTRWVGFLLSDPVLQEKGSDASQNGVNCEKGHLFGVTAPKYSGKRKCRLFTPQISLKRWC